MRGSSHICRNDASVLFYLLQGGFEFFETGPHGGQQFEALVGDFHPPSVAPKQGHLDIPLQSFDLLADGRGRDVERIGGEGETQMRSHRLEYPQGSQWQSVVGGRHLKFSLTACQTLRLLPIGARSTVSWHGATGKERYHVKQCTMEYWRHDPGQRTR